jgi:hypothetical protein
MVALARASELDANPENVIQCRCTPECTATERSTNRAMPWTYEKNETRKRVENGAGGSIEEAPRKQGRMPKGGNRKSAENPLKSL